MNKLLEAMNFRHACKIFDENKSISNQHFSDILESARLSPSSMGMEPTRVLVIRDKKLRNDLKEACWGQIQVTSCSELVALKSLSAIVNPTSDYVVEISNRRGKNEEERKSWIDRYKSFIESMQNSGISIEDWTAKQSYIIASSMMNMAAYLGIDSCPMEGFDVNKVNRILNIDSANENINLFIAFGYRLNPQSKRYRINIDDMIEYR